MKETGIIVGANEFHRRNDIPFMKSEEKTK
jgi:hypothetical protein